ncbi:MAG: multiheme c-type cytochrome, partial [Gammaproteobacteria bacterium]|nr:multiheme c-type cytochrome [Gammaproteobacteria bacterium]
MLNLTRAKILTATAVVATLTIGCDNANEADPAGQMRDSASAEFVGGSACAACHANEAALWRDSHHDLALQVAAPATVLGDFDDTEFVYADTTTSFFSRGDERWVRTDGADGSLQEFRVTHAIGIEPLQQYLLELPDGHYQTLSIAWDTRPAEDGGQRWFHLYPDEQIDSDDPLHWTGTYQSWNTTCAECHSTDLRKNYESAGNGFDTTFASIDVDCEACHGPGSIHASDPTVPPPAATRVARAWVFRDGASIASLADDAPRSNEIEICAQCHSRRSQLTDDYEPQDAFLDGFRPSLLDAGLYHADGQILDEVYVYGSFLQSAMASAGVTCSDCHEPHSTALRASGNDVCARCHLTSTFDTPQHHHHAANGAGSQCVSCHMRAETYMGVDPRRDHSFRVPRPDLSTRLQSPNACNDCHAEQSSDWAAEQVAAWSPDGRQNDFHYGEALHAGRAWTEERAPLLRRVLENTEQPAIVRATAVNLLAQQMTGTDIELISRAVDSADPLVQLAALEALQSIPPERRYERAQSLLTDPRLALRIAAARALLPARGQLSERRQSDLDAALTEYVQIQRFNSDRAAGLLNLGTLMAELGRAEESARLYLVAISREPAFSAAYVNLADLYRNLGREPEAEATLREGLAVSPEDAGLNLALGLSLVRSERLAEALMQLRAAVANAPDAPYYAYVLGVALNSAEQSAAALATLRITHTRF